MKVYPLNFADSSVSHHILYDVWPHHSYPGTALCECPHVLAPGGRLIHGLMLSLDFLNTPLPWLFAASPLVVLDKRKV